MLRRTHHHCRSGPCTLTRFAIAPTRCSTAKRCRHIASPWDRIPRYTFHHCMSGPSRSPARSATAPARRSAAGHSRHIAYLRDHTPSRRCCSKRCRSSPLRLLARPRRGRARRRQAASCTLPWSPPRPRSTRHARPSKLSPFQQSSPGRPTCQDRGFRRRSPPCSASALYTPPFNASSPHHPCSPSSARFLQSSPRAVAPRPRAPSRTAGRSAAPSAPCARYRPTRR